MPRSLSMDPKIEMTSFKVLNFLGIPPVDVESTGGLHLVQWAVSEMACFTLLFVGLHLGQFWRLF